MVKHVRPQDCKETPNFHSLTAIAMKKKMSSPAGLWNAIPLDMFTELGNRLPEYYLSALRTGCKNWNHGVLKTLVSLSPRLLHESLPCKFDSLQSLDLTNCKTPTPEQLQALGKLKYLQSLTLRLPPGPVGNLLVELGKLNGLCSINLSGSESLSDAGMLALTWLPNLRHVRLDDCPGVGDAGLVTLAQGLPLLETLSLALSEPVDYAMAHKVTGRALAALASLEGLHELDLRNQSGVDAVGARDPGPRPRWDLPHSPAPVQLSGH
eukprot:jgi/Botrbrau1/10083/Bobra.0355s0036.1